MLVQFKLDYKDSIDRVVQNHEQISDRYIHKGSFWIDALALTPFHIMKL